MPAWEIAPFTTGSNGSFYSIIKHACYSKLDFHNQASLLYRYKFGHYCRHQVPKIAAAVAEYTTARIPVLAVALEQASMQLPIVCQAMEAI